MPKASRYIDIKPEIDQHFREGKTAYDVLKLYPGLPAGTAYHWFQSFVGNIRIRAPRVSEDDLTDFQLVHKTLRDILTNKSFKNNPNLVKVRLQAALELTKLNQYPLEVDERSQREERDIDLDDLTKYFGEHLRVSEIQPPQLIEVSKENLPNATLDNESMFSIRGNTYQVISYNPNSDTWVCELV